MANAPEREGVQAHGALGLAPSEREPGHTGAALEQYVNDLSAQMEYSADVQGGGIPTAEKLAQQVVLKADLPEIRLDLKAFGKRPSIGISSATETSPKRTDRQGQVAVLLEAAARHRKVVESMTGKDPMSRVVIMTARARANRFIKEAGKLIEQGQPGKSLKRKILETSIVLGLALAACGKASTPEVAAGKTPVATEVSLDPQQGEPTIEPTENTIPESLAEQMPKLTQAGYRLEATSQGWELVSSNGEPVLSTPEPATVVIYLENSEAKIYPQEDYELRNTIGAGVDFIQTVKGPDGNVEYMYLEKVGYWVKPIEQQTDPEVIENYPNINLEDVWNGRVVYSELLTAEPFPEGTLVPNAFVYTIFESSGIDYFVALRGLYSHPDHPNGVYDTGDTYLTEMLRQGNDPQRWVAFYRTVTPEGKEAIIGTRQVMATGGEASLFLHYIFGPEWPTKDVKKGQVTYNLVQTVFLNHTEPGFGRGGAKYSRANLIPVIYTEYDGFDGQVYGVQDAGESGGAGEEVYILDQNNPVLIDPDLLTKIRATAEKLTGRTEPVDWAGEEINYLQYQALIGWSAYITQAEYFETQP